ncbi:MAG: ATP-binding protein [Sellimonas intestinalis]|uniref:ATP-binding protein n=1 Tax=Sellimonas intestinalis TaxID=1653434 RepID=UPI0039914948
MEIIKGKIKKCKESSDLRTGKELGSQRLRPNFQIRYLSIRKRSTNDMDVARLPRPTSWIMLLEELQYVEKNPGVCKTLVIDTIDWAEQLCVEHICAKHNKSGIEDFGYGNGYVYTKEEFGRFLNKLTDVIETGVNVVLTAHAQLRKFEQPDEMGAYDRWELKLGKKTQSQTSPLVKEWADMLLFCNYKTYSIAVDDKGKKHKAQGGKRVMYTCHHPCWDAKNRYNLPEECELDYGVIAGIIEQTTQMLPSGTEQKATVRETPPAPTPDPVLTGTEGNQMDLNDRKAKNVPQKTEPPKGQPVPKNSVFHVDERIPKALRDLMEDKLVSEEEIQTVVAGKGYYPQTTPILNYDPDFISGVLVGAWPQVYEMIRKLREDYEIPFDEK